MKHVRDSPKFQAYSQGMTITLKESLFAKNRRETSRRHGQLKGAGTISGTLRGNAVLQRDENGNGECVLFPMRRRCPGELHLLHRSRRKNNRGERVRAAERTLAFTTIYSMSLSICWLWVEVVLYRWITHGHGFDLASSSANLILSARTDAGAAPAPMGRQSGVLRNRRGNGCGRSGITTRDFTKRAPQRDRRRCLRR